MTEQEPFDVAAAVEAAERSGMSPEDLMEKWTAKRRALIDHADELEKFMEMRPKPKVTAANENDGTNS